MFALVLALSIGGAEVALRVQPFVPLDYRMPTRPPEARLSQHYHHERQEIADSPFAKFGECDVASTQHLKLLFLGDSWMQSTAGIPTGFANALVEQTAVDACYDVINGGTVSFSPSLMLVKGRKLISEHHPAFVVVYVDETDLMDESVRYMRTTLRGADGTIERVVPNVVDLVSVYERPVLAQQPSYILRLLELTYYEKVLMPRLTTAVFGSDEPIGSYERIMGPRLSDAGKSLGPEIAYFRASLREMLTTFVQLVGPDRILIARHPHFLHLADGGRTPRYDNSLSELLAVETAAAGVLYYDAGQNLPTIYGGEDPAAYMTWPTDPFSHLTTAGYEKFGRALARYAAPRIDELLRPRAAETLSQAGDTGPVTAR